MITRLPVHLACDLSRALSGVTPAPSVDDQILALSPYSYVESDYYAVDEESGKVAAFLDKVSAGTGIKAVDPTHAFSQAVFANQVAVPATDALFANRVSANVAGNEFYDSTAPASAWKCLHDGTGFTMVFVATANSDSASGTAHAFASTMDLDAFPTSVGSTFRYQAQTGRLSMVVARANATATVNTSFVVAGWANGSPRWARFRYKESEVPEYNVLDKGTTVISGNSAAAPSSANPSQTLRLFSDYAPSTYGLKAKWVSKITWNRLLNASEISDVHAYIFEKYGIAA